MAEEFFGILRYAQDDSKNLQRHLQEENKRQDKNNGKSKNKSKDNSNSKNTSRSPAGDDTQRARGKGHGKSSEEINPVRRHALTVTNRLHTMRHSCMR